MRKLYPAFCKIFNLVKRISIATFIYSINLYAQNEPKPAINAIACVKADKVIFRWSPTTPVSGEFCNQYGYTIEKYVIVNDVKVVNKSVKKQLILVSLKPKSFMALQIGPEQNIEFFMKVLLSQKFNYLQLLGLI